MRMRFAAACWLGVLLLAIFANAQSVPAPGPMAIPVEDLPKAALWQQYHFRVPVTGGVGLYHWRLYGGQLPSGFKLTDDGELSGPPLEAGQFDFVFQVTDSDNPPNRLQKKFSLLL